MDLTTGTETTIGPSLSSSYFPDWSDDSTHIAFDSNYQDPRGANVIWVMNRDGSGLQDISVHGTGEWRMPRWEPNGQRIVHIRYVGIGEPEIFMMDPAGQNAVRLTNDHDVDYYPSWSPTGAEIIWSKEGSSDPARNGIWIMQADGTQIRELIEGGSKPDWSPDGTKIAFARADSGFVHLWTMNPDGSGASRLQLPAQQTP